MRVVIETLDGERLWEREHGKGLSLPASARTDGSGIACVAALEGALWQLRGALGLYDAHAERMFHQPFDGTAMPEVAMRDLLHDTAAFFAIGAMIAGISLMLAGLIL